MKFKAYDVKQKKIISNDINIVFGLSGEVRCIDPKGYVQGSIYNKLKLLQYLGIKDINKIDVCNGASCDLITNTGRVKGVVVYKNCAFWLRHKDGYYPLCNLESDGYAIEMVGEYEG